MRTQRLLLSILVFSLATSLGYAASKGADSTKPVKAKQTKKPVKDGVEAKAAIDGTKEHVAEACSGSGWIRSVNVNGGCYKQMCCGGQWNYYTIGAQYCTCNLGQSWNISCDGHTNILPCR
jgi:hypothetical protein